MSEILPLLKRIFLEVFDLVVTFFCDLVDVLTKYFELFT